MVSRVIRTNYLQALCLSATFFLAQASTLAKETRVPGWVLKQDSTLTGPVIVHACPIGIKVINEKSGVVILMSPLSGIVTVYSDQTRKLYQTPLAKLSIVLNTGVVLTTGRVFSDLPLQPGGNVDVAHLSGKLYVAPHSLEEKAKADVREGRADKGCAGAVQYAVSDHLQLPAEEGRLMARIYGLPEGKGFPLRFSYDDARKKNHVILDTTSAKKEMLSRGQFAIPQKYFPVRSQSEVAVSQQSSDDFADMVGGLGKALIQRK